MKKLQSRKNSKKTSRVFTERTMKRRNGIAKATPFPENILMLFYECRPYESDFFTTHIDFRKFSAQQVPAGRSPEKSG